VGGAKCHKGHSPTGVLRNPGAAACRRRSANRLLDDVLAFPLYNYSFQLIYFSSFIQEKFTFFSHIYFCIAFLLNRHNG
jgi:hypothetical protein